MLILLPDPNVCKACCRSWWGKWDDRGAIHAFWIGLSRVVALLKEEPWNFFNGSFIIFQMSKTLHFHEHLIIASVEVSMMLWSHPKQLQCILVLHLFIKLGVPSLDRVWWLRLESTIMIVNWHEISPRCTGSPVSTLFVSAYGCITSLSYLLSLETSVVNGRIHSAALALHHGWLVQFFLSCASSSRCKVWYMEDLGLVLLHIIACQGVETLGKVLSPSGYSYIEDLDIVIQLSIGISLLWGLCISSVAVSSWHFPLWNPLNSWSLRSILEFGATAETSLTAWRLHGVLEVLDAHVSCVT